MARKERFGEVHRLRVDGVAVDARRVDARRRTGGAARGGAAGNKDVVPDIDGKDRQLGMRDRAPHNMVRRSRSRRAAGPACLPHKVITRSGPRIYGDQGRGYGSYRTERIHTAKASMMVCR